MSSKKIDKDIISENRNDVSGENDKDIYVGNRDVVIV